MELHVCFSSLCLQSCLLTSHWPKPHSEPRDKVGGAYKKNTGRKKGINAISLPQGPNINTHCSGCSLYSGEQAFRAWGTVEKKSNK